MGRNGQRGRGGVGGDLNNDRIEVLETVSIPWTGAIRRDYPGEVGDILRVVNEISRIYGRGVTDIQVSKIGRGGRNILAYYDSEGNVAVNEKYFNFQKMGEAMDRSVKAGFHPPIGNKTGMEAVIAHEMGHRITELAGQRAGYGNWALNKVAEEICAKAARQLGYTSKAKMTDTISGYAKKNWSEAVAEAFGDVYCNGNGAKPASRAIVARLNDYFNGRGIR